MRDPRATTDGLPPRPGFENASAPAPIDPRTGQHEAYWVLSAEERAKGFVRPFRDTYIHVGRVVCGKPKAGDLPPGATVAVCVMRPGHEGECLQWQALGEEEHAAFLRRGRLGGCGTVTTMGRALAETYARDPQFYGATFCVACRAHLPVGPDGDFVWEGTDEKVGT